MSIDERLRTGLLANTAHLQVEPDALERELSVVRRRARRRSRRRSAAVVLAAAVLAAVAWLAADRSLLRSEQAPGPVQRPDSAGGARSMAGVDGRLEPGRWIVPFWGAHTDRLPRAVVEVPAGYGSPGGWVVDRGADGDPQHHGDVAFWTVDTVVSEPCRGAATTVGPSVRDLVSALRSARGVRTTAPQPVTVDGRHGFYLEVITPRDPVAYRHCPRGRLTLGYTDDGAAVATDIPGTVFRLWVLDVDGTRTVLLVTSTPSETERDVAELLGIGRSTVFLPPLHPSP